MADGRPYASWRRRSLAEVLELQRPILSGRPASAIRVRCVVMRAGHVSHGNGEIYYESTGDGPAVLFLHVGVADSRMWRGQMGLDGYQTITFDQRGFGKTEWARGPFANRHDALAVLDHLQRETAIVVGCSNGGETALQLALVAPQRVTGLVLVATAARGWEPVEGWTDDPRFVEAEAALEAGDVPRMVQLDAEIWLGGHGRSLDQVEPALVSLFREMDTKPAMTESERNQHVQTLDPPTSERLDEIETPTLAVVGEYDTPDLIESAIFLAERLGDREAVVMKDAAHLPPLEVPEAFNTVLKSFLESI
ncbi:MAG: alpha/beta hydrolase [Acidimicrobiia bacterium]